ncbi:hypothetical protein AB0L74_24030 [Streptomyces sp. NPDC052020]|uniref:hypothetical protein n=1 Tax=Streptomyces sp. NPDC052020 TaxID=3155677 RepID=UPI0034465361
MDNTPDAARTLAEIERVQQKAYADQRLPSWYLPGTVALVTTAVIAVELDGTARIALSLAEVAGLGALTAALAARARVRWRLHTWTVSAGIRMALWMASILAVWGLTAVITGTLTGSALWRKVLAGLVAAAYTAATTRWAENQVLAHSTGKVAR